MVTRSEWQWCLAAAAAVMALTCLPYLWLWAITPPEMRFLGFLVSLDDQCVYLAWMKQAAEGHFFLRSLWTADPQEGLNVHLLFSLLGTISRVTSLPLPLTYHLGRIALGAVVLLLFYRITAYYTDSVPARRAAFWLVGLSAGFGWLTRSDDFSGFVDWWQTEAITFQSLFANTLFCAGLALMLGVLGGLVAAERTGRRRWAVVAGLCGGLLANIHSYDMFPIAAVWITYLLLRTALERRAPVRSLGDSLIAAAIAVPGVAYQLYVYTHETVFRLRADETIIPTAAWWKIALGFGLLVPLAVWGAGLLIGRSKGEREHSRLLLPVVWAVVGFLVPYLPVSFQWKMVMGLQLPFALLAGIALAHLAAAAVRRAPKSSAPRASAAIVTAVVLLTLPTNVIKIVHQINLAVDKNLSGNNTHPTFWYASELDVLEWADQHVAGDPVFQAIPVTAAIIPPFTGNRVWAGHWSETPSFGTRFDQFLSLFFAPMAPEAREQFLANTGITHVLFGPRERYVDRALNGNVSVIEPQFRAAPYLVPIHTSGTGDLETTLFAYRPAGGP